MKTSLIVMAALTVLISIGLRWREDRVGALRPAKGTPKGQRRGFIAAQKHRVNRWMTAAALAAVVTLAVLGGLHWLRVWQG